jgi:hypothetical protein
LAAIPPVEFAYQPPEASEALEMIQRRFVIQHPFVFPQG